MVHGLKIHICISGRFTKRKKMHLKYFLYLNFRKIMAVVLVQNSSAAAICVILTILFENHTFIFGKCRVKYKS